MSINFYAAAWSRMVSNSLERKVPRENNTIPAQVALYQARRDTLCNGLERIGWQVDKPGAGMFAWVKIPEPYAKMGSMQFAIEMMNRANVAVAPPGSRFQ